MTRPTRGPSGSNGKRPSRNRVRWNPPTEIAKTPYSVSTRGRWARRSIATPSARPTIAARRLLCVRMSMKLTSILAVYDASVRHLFVAAATLAFTALPALAQDADFPAEAEAESDPGFARLANPGFPSPEVRSVPIDRGPKIERADLSPYFTEGKLAEARAAFEAGSYSRAIALLDGIQDTGPTRFLRALAAHR